LKVFKREIVKNIRLYGQLHRFLPELASSFGVKMAEVAVNDRTRISGKSKYGSITRTPRVVLDLITVTYLLTFFTSPMRLFGSLALFCSLSGFVIGGSLAGLKIYHGIMGGWIGFQPSVIAFIHPINCNWCTATNDGFFRRNDHAYIL
jgi:hypothetical protein